MEEKAREMVWAISVVRLVFVVVSLVPLEVKE